MERGSLRSTPTAMPFPIPQYYRRFGYLGLIVDKKPSKSERFQLQRVFEIFDKDKDGRISVHDLRRTMKALGKTSTPVEELVEMLDRASSATGAHDHLNLQQFQSYLLSITLPEDTDLFTETARILYLNEDFASRMLHLRNRQVRCHPGSPSRARIHHLTGIYL